MKPQLSQNLSLKTVKTPYLLKIHLLHETNHSLTSRHYSSIYERVLHTSAGGYSTLFQFPSVTPPLSKGDKILFNCP